MTSHLVPTRSARISRFWLCVAIFVSYLTPSSAHEAIENTPSALLVTVFFDQVVKITFPTAQGSGPSLHTEPDSGNIDKTVPTGGETQDAAGSRQDVKNDRIDALRQVLSRSIDADAIAHFILGRYASGAAAKVAANPGTKLPSRTPANGLLDFAAETVAEMGPNSSTSKSTHARHQPALSILDMTVRPDQRRLVSTELTLPNGHILPLIWEIAARPEGLRIEDVDCYGISIRLMLRSAVAQAAAEHPDEVTDLGALLGAGNALGGASRLQGAP